MKIYESSIIIILGILAFSAILGLLSHRYINDEKDRDIDYRKPARYHD